MGAQRSRRVSRVECMMFIAISVLNTVSWKDAAKGDVWGKWRRRVRERR